MKQKRDKSLIPSIELETDVINILEKAHLDLVGHQRDLDLVGHQRDLVGHQRQSGIVIDLLAFGTTDPDWYSADIVEELIEGEA